MPVLTLPPGEHAAHDQQKTEDERRDEHVEAFRRDLSRGHEDNHGDDRGDGPKDAEDYASNVSNGRSPPDEGQQEPSPFPRRSSPQADSLAGSPDGRRLPPLIRSHKVSDSSAMIAGTATKTTNSASLFA